MFWDHPTHLLHFFIFLYLFYVMYINALAACIYTMCLPCACRGSEKGTGSLRYVITMVVSYHMGVGKQIQILYKSNNCF